MTIREEVPNLSVKSGNNSVVECNLAKVEVAGSNPVSRSIFYERRHSQVVRQRSAKPLYTGSNPVAASSHFKELANLANSFFASSPVRLNFALS